MKVSQSSSIPLQDSMEGCLAEQVPQRPLPQVWVPFSQAVLQSLVRFSSAMLLQSSSTLLQVSAAGLPGTQTWGTLFRQLVTVREQAPTPQVVCPRFSSVALSQSSSSPLQISGEGTHSWKQPPFEQYQPIAQEIPQ